MEIKSYICPQCGASLNVEAGTTLTFCPYCGSRLHISYEDGKAPADRNMREFTAQGSGVRLASASVPDGFTISGALSSEWQSDYVPFTYIVSANHAQEGISMLAASREMYSDYRNPAMRSMLRLSTTVIRSGLREFTEPVDYLTHFASYMTGLQLTPVATASLPTSFASNAGSEANVLYGEFNQTASLDAAVGYKLTNLAMEPLLIKYRAATNEGEKLVLCGGEIYGYEMSAGAFGLMSGIGDAAEKAIGGLKSMFSSPDTRGASEASGSSGTAGMTFDDFLHGGLIGKKMRERREAAQGAAPAGAMQQNQQRAGAAPSPEQGPRQVPKDGKIPLGHASEYGRRSDVVVWGSKRRFLMVAPMEKEEAATRIFLKFISTLTQDPALDEQAGRMIAARVQQVAGTNAQMSMQAQQMQMQTRQMQMQTSQMIANNSRQVSAGVMDSWNKRQAAQSRASAGFSEAVRGVNTYTTPTGGTVEMSTGADHVYQDRYGDTIGVSGSAVDQDLASQLGWTELKKKD